MKYSTLIGFSTLRLESPASDQALLTRDPKAQWPVWSSATIDGPILNFPWPNTIFVAVGSTNTGPTPKISLCGLAGVKKMVGTISPNPDTPAFACTACAARYAGVFSLMPYTSRLAVPGAGWYRIGA